MASVLAAARQLALDVEALLLPVACLACERTVHGEGRVICDPCLLAMRPIAPPRCERCGHLLDRWELPSHPTAGEGSGPEACCGFCREWPAALGWAESAVWLEEGPARRLAHALKYDGWRCAARVMAQVVARTCWSRLSEAAVLVPIPLGTARRRERGHNQAESLARALADAAPHPLPVAARLLSRKRETRSQTALAPAERRVNVAGAFAAAPGAAGRRIVLVDDVLTTGATVAAAAAALAEAGAKEVGALTFARAVKPA